MAKPKTYERLKQQGEDALEKEEYSKALLLFEKALRLEPRNPEALKNVGNVYLHQKDFGQAKSYYKQAIEISPGYGYAHNNLCIVYREEGAIELAILYGENAVELCSDHSLSHNTLGNLYSILKDYNKAEYHYKKAIESKHDNTTIAQYNYGRLLWNIKHYSEALDLFEKVRENPPKTQEIPTLYYLGHLYAKQNDPKNKIKAYEELLLLNSKKDELTPEFIRWVYNELVETYISIDNPDMAQKYVDKLSASS